MIGVLIDQMMYTHYYSIYNEFRSEFKYPKLRSHVGSGMVSANWMIYTHHRYHENMDWQQTAQISEVLFGDLITWLQGKIDTNDFISLLKQELKNEFEMAHWGLLEQNVMSKITAHLSGSQ